MFSINFLLKLSVQTLHGETPAWRRQCGIMCYSMREEYFRARWDPKKKWEGERGDGLGSAAPTRQLNAPRPWWISNWRLITSEVCWIRVPVMNVGRRAWQISVVTPLRELWVEGRQMWARLIQHTGSACDIRVCVLSLNLNNMCVDTVKMGLWHVKNNREGNGVGSGRNITEQRREKEGGKQG